MLTRYPHSAHAISAIGVDYAIGGEWISKRDPKTTLAGMRAGATNSGTHRLSRRCGCHRSWEDSPTDTETCDGDTRIYRFEVPGTSEGYIAALPLPLSRPSTGVTI